MNMNVPMQPTPTSYKLVQSTDAATFQREVNALLQEGYVFHGPTNINEKGMFTQPMIQLEVRPIKVAKLDSSIMPVEGIIQR